MASKKLYKVTMVRSVFQDAYVRAESENKAIDTVEKLGFGDVRYIKDPEIIEDIMEAEPIEHKAPYDDKRLSKLSLGDRKAFIIR